MSRETEFVDAVLAMRTAQEQYLCHRRPNDLFVSRRLEAVVDRLLKTIRGDVYKSAHPLFDREDEP